MLKRSELWRLSKTVYGEVYYKAQLASSGVQKAKILEKYEKNLASARRSTWFINFVVCIVLIDVSVFPIFSLLQLLSINKTADNINALVFTSSMILSVYNVIIFLYMFMFGIMNLVTFMKGECYTFLRPYPLTRNDLQHLTVFSLIRMYMIQYTVILLIVPIGVLLATLNPFVFLILLLNNAINLIFVFFCLMIVAYFLAQKVFKSPENSVIGNVIMIGSVIIYIATIVPIIIGINSINDIMASLYSSSIISSPVTFGTSLILSLLAYPFSVSYLTTLVLLPFDMIPGSLLLTASLGVLVFLGLTYIVVRKGNSLVRKIAYDPVDGSYSSRRTVAGVTVELRVSSPLITFIKKSLKLLTREYGSLSYFFLGIIFPLMFILYFFIIPHYSQLFTLEGYFMFITITMGFPVLFMNESLSTSEKHLGGVLASLPFRNRDLFRSRQIITFIAAQVPVMILLLVAVIMDAVTTQLIQVAVVQVFQIYLAMTSFLVTFSLLYGKVNKTYTLFEVNLEHKIIKVIIIMVVIYGVMISNSIAIEILYNALKSVFNWYMGIVILINAIFFLVLEIIARKVFK
ncbi:MAG: hypothetical protein ACFFD4_35530 [Candidatus Odinarchaeota archaeon]